MKELERPRDEVILSNLLKNNYGSYVNEEGKALDSAYYFDAEV